MRGKTLKEATVEMLRERGSLHFRAITEDLLQRSLASLLSKTSAASLNAMNAVDVKQNVSKSEFVRVCPGVFGLRALHAVAATPDVLPGELASGEDGPAAEKTQDEAEHRVRPPLFPTCAEVRHLLKVWRCLCKRVTGFHPMFGELCGKLQNSVDRTEPGHWMARLLKDRDKLIDLFMDHGFGVKNIKIEVLSLAPCPFAHYGQEA